MKILVCLAFLALLCSCSSPDSTANDFMNALTQGNYDDAKAVSTTKTHKILGIIEAASKLGSKKDLAELKNKDIDCTCQEDGDKANCDCCDPEASKDECMELTLVKEDDKWLVDMSKENSFKLN